MRKYKQEKDICPRCKINMKGIRARRCRECFGKNKGSKLSKLEKKRKS